MRCSMRPCALFLVAFALLDGVLALVRLSPSVALPRRSRVSQRFNVGSARLLPLHAKKSDREAKGFGKVKENAAQTPSNGVATASELKISGATSTGDLPSSSSKSGSSASSSSAPTDAEAIFKKYGIKDGDGQQKKAAKKAARSEDAPFGESVIAGLPAKTQETIDNVLITATFVSLSFVVLCGVGMSAGALKVVFKDLEVPETFDALIVNVLTPAFTPAFLIFLFFSVTFGLFKFAQISSSQTVYKEVE